MFTISRTDSSVLGRWWWTIDRVMVGLVLGLSFFGCLLVAAASPAVAERIGLSSFHFVNLHLMYLVVALAAMIILSMFSETNLRRLAIMGLIGALILMLATLFVGFETKGASRWIYIGPVSLQPSEFMKPCLAVVAAWLLSRQIEGLATRNYAILAGFVIITLTLLLKQPDFGMTVVTVCMIGAEIFMAGLPFWFMGVMGVAALGVGIGAYMFLPHVTSRINRFLNPASGDTYQIEKSIESFANGGLFGVGPGEGTVKMMLPDAHADFIFAVSGEEMGLIWTIILMILFSAIIYRAVTKALNGDNLFSVLAITGLMTIFTVQTFIHMASSLHMIPTKGMTLPFVSYGGSSLVAMGVLMGFVLGFTRKKPSYKGVKSIRPVSEGTLGAGSIPMAGKVR